MGHGITQLDRMAYVGELPWHGIGTYVGATPCSAKEMQVAAGLEWEVELRPALFRRLDGGIGEVEGRHAVVRKDTELGLGTVGSRYVEVQNRTLFEVLDALQEEGGARMHTAGSLDGCRKVWAMAELPLGWTVRRRDGSTDAHAAFLLATTSHDGTGAVILKPTDVRVVCKNTRGMALRDGLEAASIRHTASAQDRIETVARVLGGLPAVVEREAETLAVLADAPMTREECVEYASAVLLGLRAESRAHARQLIAETTEKQTEASRTRLANQLGEIVRKFERGIGNTGDSRYDALNALTEWIDHKRSAHRGTADRLAQTAKAMDSAVYGGGARRKAAAVDLLTRW